MHLRPPLKQKHGQNMLLERCKRTKKLSNSIPPLLIFLIEVWAVITLAIIWFIFAHDLSWGFYINSCLMTSGYLDLRLSTWMSQRTVVAQMSAESIANKLLVLLRGDGHQLSVLGCGLNHSILIGISKLENRFSLAAMIRTAVGSEVWQMCNLLTSETNSSWTLHVFQLSNLTARM